MLTALVISSRMKLEILIQCTSSSVTAWWCKFSFLHSFMDGCSSLLLLLLIDVCWHHKIWGITSLLWHSMMHYWLLRYFFFVWGSFGFPYFFFLLTSLHFRRFHTKSGTESFNINLVCDLFLLISIHSLIQFS